MTEDQIALCEKLVFGAFGHQEVTGAEFANQFPTALEHGKLSTRLLQDAIDSKDWREFRAALQVGFEFGFTVEQADILIPVLDKDWHVNHEEIVQILVDFHTPKAIEPFFRATQWVPAYLDFDEARALAVKAIWGLGKLPGPETEEKLKILAKSDVEVIRKNALYQLERRGEKN